MRLGELELLLFGLFASFFSFFLVFRVFRDFFQFVFVVFSFEFFDQPSEDSALRARGRRAGFDAGAAGERGGGDQRKYERGA